MADPRRPSVKDLVTSNGDESFDDNHWANAADEAGFLKGSVWDGLSRHGMIETLRQFGIYPGATLDRYILGHELGVGGSSVVYQATRCEPIERSVAIKVMVGTAGLHRGQSRFEREWQILAELDHPGLTKVLDFGTSPNGVRYIVMPLIHGEPIDRYCERNASSLTEIAAMLEQVCRSIEHAHQCHVVHRDLTPGNILVQHDGRPVVTDFGIAHWRHEDAPRTVTGHMMGTPGYLAPEQCLGRVSPKYEPLVDVYSIGATLYRLLTGRPPHRGGTVLETVAAMQHEQVPSPQKLNPDIPDDLTQICLKCLSKRPQDRYKSMAELGDDLQRFRRDLPVVARPISWWGKSARWAEENRLTAGLLALLGLTIVGSLIGLTILWRSAAAGFEAATENLELARSIVRETTVRAAEQLYRDQGALADQRQLLEKGLTFYEQLLDRRPDDPSLRSEYGSVWFQLGGVCVQLDDNQAGANAYRKSLSIFESLLKEHPENTSWQFDRFHCCHALYFVLTTLGEEDAGMLSLTAATEALDRVVELAPENVDYLDALACLLQERSGLANGNKQWDEAELLAKRAWDVSQRLEEHVDQKPQLLRQQGNAAMRLAYAMFAKRDFDAALRWAKLSVSIGERLISLVPNEAMYYVDLSEHHVILFKTLRETGQTDLALRLTSKLEAQLKDAIERQPDWWILQREIARVVELRASLGGGEF